MALQLGNFTPLQQKHYQLAETQDEKDAAASRQANLIAQQGLNSVAAANAHAAGQIAVQQPRIAEEARQADMRDAQAQESLAATVAQQGVSNDLAQQRIDQDQQRISSVIAQNGVENALKQRQESRLQTVADIAKAEEARKAEEYKQAQELKQIPVAMAKFGHYLSTAQPDDNGMVDVTDQKDTIKTMVGGFGDQNFKRITAQNVDGKTRLFGYSDDDKAQPITRNGNQVAIDNNVLQKQAMFYTGSDARSAKAQAELEQTQIENETKRAELDYLKKHGVKVGTSGKDDSDIETKIVPDQMGGQTINQVNKRTGEVISTPVTMDGKIGQPIRIGGPGAGNQQQQPERMQFKQGWATKINGKWVLDKQ